MSVDKINLLSDSESDTSDDTPPPVGMCIIIVYVYVTTSVELFQIVVDKSKPFLSQQKVAENAQKVWQMQNILKVYANFEV